MTACAAYGCNSTFKKSSKDVSFHRFPVDEKFRALWIKAMRVKDWTPGPCDRLCSIHFEKSCFRPGKSKPFLHRDAVPSIFPAFPSYFQKKMPMPRRLIPKHGVNVYKKYDSELLKKAVEEAKVKSLSVVAQKYGISKSALSRHKIRVMKSPGGQPALTSKQENIILNRIKKSLEWGCPITRSDLKNIIKSYLDNQRIFVKKFKNNLPGGDFITGFLKRHREKLPEKLFMSKKWPVYQGRNGKLTSKEEAYRLEAEAAHSTENNEQRVLFSWPKILDSLVNKYEDGKNDGETLMYLLVVASKKKDGNTSGGAHTRKVQDIKNFKVTAS